MVTAKQPSILILSIGTLILTIASYLFLAPTWVFPLIIVFYINLIFILNYHQKVSQNQTKTSTQITKYQEDYDDLEMAKRVQQALLSAEVPQHPRLNITRRCIPAKHLGGDFYTFINKSVTHSVQETKIPGVVAYTNQAENYIGFAIGDVAGHGVSSALVMALSAALFDKIAQTHDSPADTLQRANNDIRKFIENSHISHVTAFYATLNLQTMELTYSRAGHHPALLLKKDKRVKELTSEGVFLGMFKNEKYKEEKIKLEAGDRLFLYTDGIIEASDIEGNMFGQEQFIEIITKHQNSPIDKVLDIVFNAVKAYNPHQETKDDQTMIIIDIL